MMSHNVWADLGFDDAEGMQRKCDLSIEIEAVIRDAKLSARAAARTIGIAPAELSALLHGHFEDMSIAMLERYLETLRNSLLQRN